jgi:hypothetical protein
MNVPVAKEKSIAAGVGEMTAGRNAIEKGLAQSQSLSRQST